METDLNFWLQLAVMLVCIGVGGVFLLGLRSGYRDLGDAGGPRIPAHFLAVMRDDDVSGVADGVGFTSITVAWLSQLNSFAMIAISMILAILEKGSNTLQTRMEVPASIADIITGILLFCMLSCEFFINYRLIFRHKESKEVKA